jgi:hypothetical protein
MRQFIARVVKNTACRRCNKKGGWFHPGRELCHNCLQAVMALGYNRKLDEAFQHVRKLTNKIKELQNANKNNA